MEEGIRASEFEVILRFERVPFFAVGKADDEDVSIMSDSEC